MSHLPTVYDSDESLAEALMQGNQEVLNILYDRYSAALFGVLQKITGNTGKAEEALQLCFITIWQNKQLYNSSKGKLFTWMFGIAKEAATLVTAKKNEDTANQNLNSLVNSNNSGNEEWKNPALITELIIFGGISQEEAAEKMGISIIELRKIIRKEINKLRGI